MTARSGDALSHVNFQAGQTSFLTAIDCPRIRLDAPYPTSRSTAVGLVPPVFA
ncbi:hypothetical protein V1294_000929 [Bradyrhizobium sp. AZCC 1678]